MSSKRIIDKETGIFIRDRRRVYVHYTIARNGATTIKKEDYHDNSI